MAEATKATLRQERLTFPPIYVVVGAYRFVTDKNLYVPSWQKCKHGFVRGAVVGVVWVGAISKKLSTVMKRLNIGCLQAALTFNVQRAFVRAFLSK